MSENRTVDVAEQPAQNIFHLHFICLDACLKFGIQAFKETSFLPAHITERWHARPQTTGA